MEQLRNICRMIRVIEAEAERLETTATKKPSPTISEALIEIYRTRYPEIKVVKENYMKKYKCSLAKANAVYSDLKKDEYIDEYPIPSKSNFKPMHYVSVNTKGRKINGTWLKIPTSRYNAWLAENSNLENFLGGGAFGIVVAFVVWLCKTYLLK